MSVIDTIYDLCANARLQVLSVSMYKHLMGIQPYVCFSSRNACWEALKLIENTHVDGITQPGKRFKADPSTKGLDHPGHMCQEWAERVGRPLKQRNMPHARGNYSTWGRQS